MRTSSDLQQKIRVLRKRSDFLNIKNAHKHCVTRGLIIQALKNDTNDIGRGITVSTRVDKRAVVRNRLKRRIRSVSADILSKHVKEGIDIVIIGRKAAIDRPYEKLAGDLKYALHQLGCHKWVQINKNPFGIAWQQALLLRLYIFTALQFHRWLARVVGFNQVALNIWLRRYANTALYVG